MLTALIDSLIETRETSVTHKLLLESPDYNNHSTKRDSQTKIFRDFQPRRIFNRDEIFANKATALISYTSPMYASALMRRHNVLNIV